MRITYLFDRPLPAFVNTHAAPLNAELPSYGPPITAVANPESDASATLVPNWAWPLSPVPVSSVCCVHAPPVSAIRLSAKIGATMTLIGMLPAYDYSSRTGWTNSKRRRSQGIERPCRTTEKLTTAKVAI